MDDPTRQGPNPPDREPPPGRGPDPVSGGGAGEAAHALRDALRAATGGEGAHGVDFQCLDLCPICRTADVLRATAPPEFKDHWYAWQREILLALRALIDHYVERLEAERRRQSVEVEDIPID